MHVAPAKHGRSIAFLLGNGSYAHAGILENPSNDVRELKRSLRRLKFLVKDYCDLSSDQLRDRFAEFVGGLTKFDTVLFYYSGHGMQIGEVNYVVPPEADIESPTFVDSLVSIQSLVGQLTRQAATTLVFLDACRNNPLGEQFNSKLRLEAKGIEPPHTSLANPGLAPFSEKSDAMEGPVFIAFAAAPGEVAWEGKGEVSPFTEGLVSTIETTDLAINNLMLRVAAHVKESTEGRQEPWSVSSLSSPYYFSKGSLVWFNANLIGFAALIAMMCIHSVILWNGSADLQRPRAGGSVRAPEISLEWLAALSSACLLVAFALFLGGIGRSYRFARGEFQKESESYLRRSLIGGFFGGIFATPAIALPYWSTWAAHAATIRGARLESLGVVLCEVLLASIATGVLLGPLSYVLAVKAHAIGKAGRYGFGLSSAGGIAGGLIVGLVIGPALTWYFGRLSRPVVVPWILLPGSLAGTAIIVFSIITYNVDRFSYRNMLVKAGAAIAGTLIAAVAAAAIVWAFEGAVSSAIVFLIGQPQSLLLIGALVGAIVGLVLGTAIGLAVALSNADFLSRFEEREGR